MGQPTAVDGVPAPRVSVPAIGAETAVALDFDQLQRMAKVFAASGYFRDVESDAQATVVLMMGQELGLRPAESIMGISIIHGKPSLSPRLMATVLNRSPKMASSS